MHRIVPFFFLSVLGLLAGGCSMMAPQYSPSIDNVQHLKDAGEYTAKVGKTDSASGPGNANPISLRGSSLVSPYDSSYAAYLGEAIKAELSLAGRLKPDAAVEISGVLIRIQHRHG